MSLYRFPMIDTGACCSGRTTALVKGLVALTEERGDVITYCASDANARRIIGMFADELAAAGVHYQINHASRIVYAGSRFRFVPSQRSEDELGMTRLHRRADHYYLECECDRIERELKALRQLQDASAGASPWR